MGMTLQTGSAPSASNTTPRQFYGSSSSVKQGDEHEAKEDKQESNLEKGEGRAPPSSSPRSLSSTARGDAHSGNSRSNSYRKRPLKESDAIRPESRKEQKMLKREDSYGHKKLRCEEYLEKKSREMGFSYAALRLCDVIGPYDNTDRFWSTYLWLKYAPEMPILPDGELGHPISITSSWDTVTAIMCEIRRVAAPATGTREQAGDHRNGGRGASSNDTHNDGSTADNHCWNIAMAEKPSLGAFLQMIARNSPPLPMRDGRCPQIRGDNNSSSHHHHHELTIRKEGGTRYGFYPSVSRGPVDISQAKKALRWSPAFPMDVAVRKTCAFFESAERRFPEDLKDAVKNLPCKVRRAVRAAMQRSKIRGKERRRG